MSKKSATVGFGLEYGESKDAKASGNSVSVSDILPRQELRGRLPTRFILR
jgi:hypothetical protein